MTSRWLIDVDYAMGKEVWSVDYEDGTAGIETRWHTDDLLSMNRREHNDGGWDRDPELRKVASIPLAVFDLWRTTTGHDALAPDADFNDLRLKLNDPDWSKLRTRGGRV